MILLRILYSVVLKKENKVSNTQKNQVLFFFYFALSTVLTWWFVAVSPLYISKQQMLLSTAVAGGKWAIQVVLGYLFLYEKRWVFLKNIGFVCFIGSCILVPYALLAQLGIANSGRLFLASLIAAVVVMVYAYYHAVLNSNVKTKWWYFWLVCLVCAISLQLTVVFHVL